MLSIQNISFGYKKHSLILQDINFVLEAGEILVILGPNGAGKTTLLKCINALLKPSLGAVIVEGHDIFKMKTDEVARRIGYVPQHSETSRISVFDAVLLGRIPYMRLRADKKDLQKVENILQQLNLEDLALKSIDELSGGELQKVCIARALVQEPKVLIFDEPTSNLDLKNQLEILTTIHNTAFKHEVIVITAMHDLNLAFNLMDKFLFMKNGKIFGAGKANAIDEKMISAVYGVPVEIFRHKGCMYVVPERNKKNT